MENNRPTDPVHDALNHHVSHGLQEEHHVDRVNLVIRRWQALAEDVLSQVEKDLSNISPEKRSFVEEFEFLSYQAIHKNLHLPDSLQVMDQGEQVTIAISFNRQPRGVLRLYLCALGAGQIPEKLYAALHYQFGRQIAFLMVDVDDELVQAEASFKTWFAEQINALAQAWLNTASAD